MISRDELTRIASKKGFRDLAIIEKDYALTWALKAIYANERLQKYLIFKGGTCLSKVYAATYRLSEDLDFSGNKTGKLSLGELEREIDAAFELANNDGAPNLQLRKDETHSNEGYAVFKARYIGPLGHPGKIKLEIKTDEYVRMPSEKLPIKESVYPDIKQCKITCYHFFELFTEKVRAMMQRGKSRDYYDVWQMLTNPDLRKNLPKMLFELRRDLLEKCVLNKIEYEPEKIFSSAMVKEARSHWKDALGYLVVELPDFDKVVEDLEKEMFEESELAKFSEDFNPEHIRNIARQEATSMLIVRAMQLAAKKLESKEVMGVRLALAAVEEINKIVAGRRELNEALMQTCQQPVKILAEDKDAKIRAEAQNVLNSLIR